MKDSRGFDAGQSHVEPLELVSESLMVDSQQGQHGRVEVVDGDDIFDGVVAKLVGRSVGCAAADSSPAIQNEKPLM